MTDFQASAHSAPIESVDQLVEDLHHAGKPRAEWRIGAEYEKVAVERATGRAAPFSGPRGIEALLRGLADRHGWAPKEEDGRLVALARDGASITLEPGAQLELSGAQFTSLHDTRRELATHVHEIVALGAELGITFLGLGIQPGSTVEEIEWVPKRRYGIMGPYMATVGTMGQRMMKQTATVQANIDYADERDAMRKMRVGMGIAPIVNAMFANSPIVDGRASGFLSFRGHVWTDTDSARCGLLPFVFRDGAGFRDYVDWALGVPVYFVLRDGSYVTDVTGIPFRDFLAGRIPGLRATLDDWQLHLTTLFPEVRLKRYIEFRSADSQTPERLLALPALVKGIFYESDCLDGAYDLVRRWSAEDVAEIYRDVLRQALDARVKGIRIVDLARELFGIAREGLRRQAVRDANGADERQYLESLAEIVASGRAPARVIAEQWTGPWERKLARLVEATAYPAELPSSA